METEKLINLLMAVKEIPLPGEKSASIVDEIIKRLREHDKCFDELAQDREKIKEMIKKI